ncbi:hypothetical protein [Montanilutibacter psychrotolerans]|uniref:Uncharacterized protein n=1 Tax=Montanilutibacter psychrotolerans TaxID=1327343 RepID=A0A3M8SSX8_9GAMM|nr:hypothetical protein [Lysobacter psychrotolerans]RNF82334.1 hypothetical protein EER27_14360 [Lysobacter psychrotolerans]
MNRSVRGLGISRFLLPILLAASLPALADAAKSPDATSFEPCGAQSLRSFREIIVTRTSRGSLHAPLDLVPMILCGNRDDGVRLSTVYDHMAERMTHVEEHTGMPPVRSQVKKSLELAAEMILATNVDYAELSASQDSLLLEYSGDACSRQVKIEVVRGAWLITEYVSSCD